jgi:hypothetical protein
MIFIAKTGKVGSEAVLLLAQRGGPVRVLARCMPPTLCGRAIGLGLRRRPGPGPRKRAGPAGAWVQHVQG